MAAIRLAEKSDKIEIVLFRSLLDGTSGVSGARDRSVISASTDPLAASTWEEVQLYDGFLLYCMMVSFYVMQDSRSNIDLHVDQVPPKDTLITPVQCKSLWGRFKAETQYIVTQAINAKACFLPFIRI